ncbi:MAG TPA: YceI family protein [Gammaproteobacteria bacterium]|nr:YceI family protein [Gammaproteobacteria bacterium]
MKSMKFSVSTQQRLPGLALTLVSLLIAGCAGMVAKSPAALPALTPLVTAGAEHYTIHSADSEIRFLVYRAGPLAAFGHNHVIHAATIHGNIYLNPDFALSGFAFTLPVNDFRVDEPAQRAAEGPDFASQPSDAAISGTRHNMLGALLLDAVRYPEITVRSVRVTGSQTSPIVTARITLHGVQHDLEVPVAVSGTGPRLIVSGKFQIKQSDFGITPFSILGGGLQVADVVKVDFRIMAVRD